MNAVASVPNPVNTHNEWDTLEEVIVGSLDGAVCQPWEAALEAVYPAENVSWLKKQHETNVGQPYDKSKVALAQSELDEFIHILTSEGVHVRRPEPIDWSQAYSTPFWSSTGNGQTCPRDVLLAIGNEIVEAPMSWRSRYFENIAYKSLLLEYFKNGARWTAAPKPRMLEGLWCNDHKQEPYRYIISESEPAFDAADVTRCGRDLFVQRSHATNRLGFEWLCRHFAPDYRCHLLEVQDELAIHIDATFCPLAVGKIMINPDRPVVNLPEFIKKAGWELFTPPKSTLPRSWPNYRYYYWLSLNVLVLDGQRVIVEKHEELLIKALKEWGFEPIPCPFRHCYEFGGGFHCFTVDIRRQSCLESYF